MKTVSVRVGKKGSVKCNYTRNFFELYEGMFADSSRPLLMEIHFLLRPTIITTKSRRSIDLPILDILTFNGKFDLVRRFEKIPNGKNICMRFNEKFVLEIPRSQNSGFKKLREIKKLEFSM